MDFQRCNVSSQTLARIRGSIDGSTTYITWFGDCYSRLPAQRAQKIFNVVGVNACSCHQLSQDSWVAVTRELSFYLDPTSHKVVHRWQNPVNQKIVPVVHVANERVQLPLPQSTEVLVSGSSATLSIDVPLRYPNILWKTDLQEYSPFEFYEAFEGFKFFFDSAELERSSAAVSGVSVAWTRISPWLPWMDMGSQPGELIFSAVGSKLLSFDDLPELIRNEIREKVPHYAHPPQYDPGAANVTSWSYFKRNFAAYQQGSDFPLSQEGERCS